MHANIALSKAKLWQAGYDAAAIQLAVGELEGEGYIQMPCSKHGASCVILTRRAMKGD